MLIELPIVIFLGLVFGSFATALSYRLPRGISIASQKRSQCPSCDRDLSFLDLVPVFSWLFLKGKCRFCKASIGVRYPLIELATLCLCLVFYFVYGFSFESLLIIILAPVLISIIDIDLNYKIIPDGLNLSIFLIGVLSFLLSAYLDGSRDFFIDSFIDSVGGLLMYGLGSLFIRQIFMWLMKREPMGLGDIKFFAAVGFWLGMSLNSLSLFMIVSGLFGVLLALTWKKITGEEEFPFGPALVFGFISVLCFFPQGYV